MSPEQRGIVAISAHTARGDVDKLQDALNRGLDAGLTVNEISYSQREIVTISALASMDGVEPYLESHMGIGMNVGLTESQISGILSVIESTVGEAKAKAKAEAGREMLSRVLASQAETQDGASNGARDGRGDADENRSTQT